MIHFLFRKMPFKNIKNLYILKEIEKSISKVSTNRTFRLSKLKVNRFRGLSVRWPNLNHDISCPPIGVKRSDLWFLFWLKWKISSSRHGVGSLINQATILWFEWMTNQNRGRDTLNTNADNRIWLADQSKVLKVFEMISDWLDNWECLFPGESSIKIDVFSVRWEKRSDVHTKGKRIRKEISPRTKVSQAKASISEKLNTIEKLHQPKISIVCLSNTTKATISFSLYIYIYIFYQWHRADKENKRKVPRKNNYRRRWNSVTSEYA